MNAKMTNLFVSVMACMSVVSVANADRVEGGVVYAKTEAAVIPAESSEFGADLGSEAELSGPEALRIEPTVAYGKEDMGEVVLGRSEGLVAAEESAEAELGLSEACYAAEVSEFLFRAWMESMLGEISLEEAVIGGWCPTMPIDKEELEEVR